MTVDTTSQMLNTNLCARHVSYVMFRPEIWHTRQPERPAKWKPSRVVEAGCGGSHEWGVMARHGVSHKPGSTGPPAAPVHRELVLRAVHDVLQPLGVTEDVLRAWLFSRAGTLAAPGLIDSENELRSALPLFASASAASLPMVQ